MRFLIFNFYLFLFCHVALSQGVNSLVDKRRSLRVDLLLSGDVTNVTMKVRGISAYNQGGTGLWGGHNSGQGEYRFTLVAKNSQCVVYQDGFSSLFDEWASSDFPGKTPVEFQQVLVMPMPMDDVELIVDKRSKKGYYYPILKQDIKVGQVAGFKPPFIAEVNQLVGFNPSSQMVDVLLVAEGYTESEKNKFKADAARFVEYFLSSVPFAGCANALNIHSVFYPSRQSGCIQPNQGKNPETVLGASFNTFGSERYLQTLNIFTLADYAAAVPHDLIVVLVNTSEYGGGGVFNSFAIGSVDHPLSMAVLMHEIGHAFAGLGDEYYDSEVPYSDFYSADVEPWEPNITTLVDFDSKWKADMANGSVGLVEGAGYSAKGIYRAQEHCLMKALNAPFCQVCQKAVATRIRLVVGEQ